MNHIQATYNDVVDLLVKKNIVCIHQGRTEAGPRALGNRSILYDPRDSNALKKVNNDKGRQWWRPFAASVLAEHAAEWFEMLNLKESPYMMYAIPVKEDKKELIPGVVHVDGTCRIQTVTEEQNYHYYHLIKSFYEETGIPMLFNTSLNLAGEVISHTISDTYGMLSKCNIEYVYEPEENKIVIFPNKQNKKLSCLYESELSRLYEDSVDDRVVDYFNQFLDQLIKDGYKCETPVKTRNGYQVGEILDKVNDSYKKGLLKDHFDIDRLHYMHMIHYYNEGYQKIHSHVHSEEFSFLMFLNDCDGDTVFFFEDGQFINVTPECGKIVYFSGNLAHEGRKSSGGKRVVVGGIDKIDEC